MAHSEMPRSSWATDSNPSLCWYPGLGLKQTGIVMHTHAASPSLARDSSGFQFPQARPQKWSIFYICLDFKSSGDLNGEGAKISLLQQGAQKLKFEFPAASRTPTSSAEHPQPTGLPYSCFSWLFGKPKLLQSDPMPLIFPAAHH